MKLISLYSNKPKIFPAIPFKPGLNVIFAQVESPEIMELDSHNLGKTFLIELIDFCLISNVQKNHPFKANAEIFEGFIFFLQILTADNRYVTIRRAVSGRNVISINVDDEESPNLTDYADSDWTLPGLSINRGREELQGLLNLSAIEPYTYRKGLGYFLRKQSDYVDEFRISKFGMAPDIEWKPYLALILGLNSKLVLRKYEIDREIQGHSNYRDKLEEEAGSKTEEYDRIRGKIEITEDKARNLRSEVDEFSFRNIETDINEDSVLRIETQIAELNKERYILDYELEEIKKSLTSELKFDLDGIKEIFDEVEVTFPEALTQSYEDLVAFNKKISIDREKRLNELKSKITASRKTLAAELSRLNEERKEAMAILKEKETLIKYRALQKRLLKYESEINDYRQQLSHLDLATTVQKSIDELNKERVEVINELTQMIQSENATLSSIRKSFSNGVDEVLSVEAVLSVKINQQGNLEFETQTLDMGDDSRITHESLGTTFKKLLCAVFDLSVSGHYQNNHFYHFIYHDGIFEGLDNRKKQSLLNLIRDYTQSKGIQYILTVIDSDLPRNEEDEKLMFTEDEIVRRLNDQGDQGRLFRMPPF